MNDPVRRLDAKLFYRKLDSLFYAMDPSRPHMDLLKAFLEESFRALRDHLHLKACLYYEEDGEVFTLQQAAGETGAGIDGSLELSDSRLQALFQHNVYIFDTAASKVGSALAGLMIGKKPTRSIFFYMLDTGWSREELDFALNTIRAALGARITEERLRGSFKEAALIQQSLLVDEPPEFAGYDISCGSIPAEEVGGDFFDFTILDPEILGLAIGDASGHGLPAALLVRDVVTGLRMGIERHLKVGIVFEKLNRVIHRSKLSSRFVSLVYGELETNGNFVYVNAGHQPPLIIKPNSVESLEAGGSVIGPLPEVRFVRGITQIDHGSILLLCTDGIVERSNSEGEFFGENRMIEIIRAHRGSSAQKMLDELFSAAFDYGNRRPWEDDASGVIVIRK
jgi:sigma-B regulation protein RsbU (phosphoserine phosphatase)